MKQKTHILSIILATSVFFASACPSQARYFDSNDIFTDAELFDSNALSRTAIQQFLESKNSVLKSVTANVNGTIKLVSEMIYEIGKTYGVSQKFLLAKLQHEQGLIEKTTATQNALDWATGYSCFGGRCNEKYKGIYAQLDAAADTQGIYARKSASSGYFGYEVGKTTKTSDGYSVTPANQATTNLYIYTPYHGSLSGIGGNFFFSRVWNKYFTERVYPDGTLLYNSETGEYWKIEKNKKRKFSSESVYLADYKKEDAVLTTSASLSYYVASDVINYPNNTIISSSDDATLYLASEGLKHRIVGESALASLGMRLANTSPVSPVLVSKNVLDSMEEGEPITEQSIYPKGELLKDEKNSVYYVKHGVKRLLLDEAVWQENFGKKEPTLVSSAVLASYKNGDPIALYDGSFVKSRDGKYYIVSNNKKKRITSESVAVAMFGQQAVLNAPVASDALLALSQDGDPIDYIDDTVQDPANYVSYAERMASQIASQPTQNQYLGSIRSIESDKSFLVGAKSTIKVIAENRGSALWQAGKVYIKMIDEDSSSSSFLAQGRVALTTDVSKGQQAVFEIPISAPLEAKKVNQWFILEYQDLSGAFYEMPGGLLSKEISSISGTTAEITSHNIPVAVKNTFKPINITVKIKNTSKDKTWTSRRAAFILRAQDGEKSPFYDSNDWIDKEIVGVPLNKSKILPGETAIVRFTIAPRKVKAGIHRLNFSMVLKDTGETVYLNGSEEFELLMRVDN